MEDYYPIANERIEDILISLQENPKEGDRKLDEFVRDELTPGKKGEQLSLSQTDEQKIIKMALFFCIDECGYDTRLTGDNFSSKHPIDAARILIKYDFGDDIDYLDVCATLLHDLIEDRGISGMKIRDHFIYPIEKSDIERKRRYELEVNEIIRRIREVTKQEGEDYNQFLERVFEKKEAAKIKLADRIAQNSEMDETLPGDFFLRSIYKNFRHIDNACTYLNQNPDDPTMRELKNMLIFSTMFRAIYPRIERLKDGKHVSEAEIKEAESKVDRLIGSGELYRLTGYKQIPPKETDIILPFYDPVMRGIKDYIRSLNDEKDKQFLHLAIWRSLFIRYYEDVLDQKHTDLFTFDWGPWAK